MLLPISVADFFKTCSPGSGGYWELGSQRVGKVALANLTCRWFMSTNLFRQGEVLGLITLGYHWVMSRNWIGGVITGSLGKA